MAESPPNQSIARRYVKSHEAAAYIGVTPRTIRKMVADGRITAYRNGSRILRVDLNELDAAMTRVRRPQPAAETLETRAAEYIRKLLDQAPPLTDDQRTRLAELLAPVRKGGAA